MSNLHLCKLCNQLVELVQVGHLPLICCGQDMTPLVANTTDASNEKHVPVVVDKGDYIEVTVGSVEHPMEEKHFIVFIEVLTTDNRVYRKELKPGEKPFATFPVKRNEVVEVREYCNLHGLWKSN